MRQFCANISTDHSQEILSLQSYLADWYGTSLEPQLAIGEIQRVETLSRVQGTRFEIKYLQNMTKYHRQGILKGLTCVEEAFHSELAYQCQTSVASSAAEIQQMQTWMCEWYDVCKPEPVTTSPDDMDAAE